VTPHWELDLREDRAVIGAGDDMHRVIKHVAGAGDQDVIEGEHRPPSWQAPGGRERPPPAERRVLVAEAQHGAERGMIEAGVEVAGQHPGPVTGRRQHPELLAPAGGAAPAGQVRRRRVNADQLAPLTARQLRQRGRLCHVRVADGRALVQREPGVDTRAA
jgi:hypothetical protein